MVGDPAIARAELHGFEEHVLIERIRTPQREVRELPFGGDLELDWHLDDCIRRATDEIAPPTWEDRAVRGHAVTLRRSRVYPGDDRVDLSLRQPALVAKSPEPWIGEPRRHLAGNDLRLDGARPRPGFPVRQQRHRSDLARSMTLDAVVEKDLRHVRVERGDCLRALLSVRRNHPPRTTQPQPD